MSHNIQPKPFKQVKIYGWPLLQAADEAVEDDAASASSSSSSGRSVAVRYVRRPVSNIIAGDDDTTSDGDGSDEHEGETTTSSGSQDSSEDSSEEGLSAPDRTRRESNLRSRLQILLPQLQRENARLTHSEAARVDNVPDDAEQYIEMDLSLGVLAEQDGEAGAVEVPNLRDEGREGVGEASASIKHPNVEYPRKRTKRKIEEVE